ncbi:cytochrome c oxidase subunit 3 [Sphingomonas morindae]|uniref:Cytochrome c oxidase subunit 3 n=1 Tax=Sphingomonas morindae TaxID=1541170 RepID=A0ABY4X603_9SPHN|nr:cytochrome c oxidase subunit 3 [Sphingomonas morindae]USI72338.1 cytochrome c oxidase subunit 3 [Sphingomonas morindae]
MSAPPATQIVGDLSGLPDSDSGPRHLVWWGNLGFMLIEGTGFALAIAAALFLWSRAPAWPPPGDAPPALLWSGLLTLGLFASGLPNGWVKRRALAKDAAGVRRGVLAMTVIGLALLAVRGFEIAALTPRWDKDAYGSAIWMLMLLHTSHILTDWGDTAVQAAWLYTHSIGDDQFADVEDNCNYWSFVIWAWVPLYAVVYWLPRLG